MSKLDRWLPFRFHRKGEQEKKQDAKSMSNISTLAPSLLAPTPFHSFFFSAPMQQLIQSFFSDSFLREPLGHFDRMGRWFGDLSPRRCTPSVEIADGGKAIRVTAELPGMSKEDVNLQIDDNALIISSENKNEEEKKDDGVFRTERYYGYFQRAIPLPEDVDKENVNAEFKKGVLTVRLPKLESAKTRGRHIEVKG